MGLPLAMLLAAIMTLGNLGENYELLAMKSAGMSLPKILKPLIIVVGIIAIGSFFVVNNLVPSMPTRRCSASSTTSASRNRSSNSRTGSSSTASRT